MQYINFKRMYIPGRISECDYIYYCLYKVHVKFFFVMLFLYFFKSSSFMNYLSPSACFLLIVLLSTQAFHSDLMICLVFLDHSKEQPSAAESLKNQRKFKELLKTNKTKSKLNSIQNKKY